MNRDLDLGPGAVGPIRRMAKDEARVPSSLPDLVSSRVRVRVVYEEDICRREYEWVIYLHNEFLEAVIDHRRRRRISNAIGIAAVLCAIVGNNQFSIEIPDQLGASADDVAPAFNEFSSLLEYRTVLNGPVNIACRLRSPPQNKAELETMIRSAMTCARVEEGCDL